MARMAAFQAAKAGWSPAGSTMDYDFEVVLLASRRHVVRIYDCNSLEEAIAKAKRIYFDDDHVDVDIDEDDDVKIVGIARRQDSASG